MSIIFLVTEYALWKLKTEILHIKMSENLLCQCEI